MFEEVFVFDGDGGLEDVWRKLGELDGSAIFFGVDFVEERTMSIENLGGNGPVTAFKGSGGREVLEDEEVDNEENGGTGKEEKPAASKPRRKRESRARHDVYYNRACYTDEEIMVVIEDVTIELERQKTRGVLLVLSGPSGVGKDTVMLELLSQHPKMQKLVTTNSRPKREDEQEGFDYFFVSRKKFEKLIAEEAFFEWVEYRGHYRGGQKKHVREALESGKDVVWRIDVRGVKNIREKVKEMFPHSVFVLLAVADLVTLQKRMEERASETQDGLKWSVNMAEWEQRQWRDFDYIVPNENGKLDATVEKVARIVEVTRMKVGRTS